MVEGDRGKTEEKAEEGQRHKIRVTICYQHFYLFSYTTSQTQHPSKKTKKTQQTYTQYPKSPVKREGEKEGQGKHRKRHSFI